MHGNQLVSGGNVFSADTTPLTLANHVHGLVAAQKAQAVWNDQRPSPGLSNRLMKW